MLLISPEIMWISNSETILIKLKEKESDGRYGGGRGEGGRGLMVLAARFTVSGT